MKKLGIVALLLLLTTVGLAAQLNYRPVENPDNLPVLVVTKMGDVICKNQGLSPRISAYLEVLYTYGEEERSLFIQIVFDRQGQFVHRRLPTTFYKIIIHRGQIS